MLATATMKANIDALTQAVKVESLWEGDNFYPYTSAD